MTANQRARLLAAAVELIAEKGYAALTVRHVVEKAGVARATFYQQFDDLQDCIVATHGEATQRLVREISGACASQGEWPEGVVAAVDAGIEFAIAAPGQASLLLAGNSVVEPGLARSGLAARHQLVGLLRVGRDRHMGAFAPPDLTEQALIGGAISLVGDRLIADQVDRLRHLKPELAEFLLAPYLGNREAGRLAGAMSIPDEPVTGD